MNDGSPDLFGSSMNIVHLPSSRRRRRRPVSPDAVQDDLLGHFREQCQKQAEQNQSLMSSLEAMHAKVDRLSNGMDRLIHEMHGVRTGRREEAFARVGDINCSIDLPTVRPDPALIYSQTAADVGEALGFRPSEIGLLLGSKGLKWADNPDYQETSRRKRPTQQRFWINDLASRLARILDKDAPQEFGITDKAVLAVFRKWQHQRCSKIVP